MRGMRYHGNRDLRLEEIAEPVVTPGTVKVAVEWTGICGSDLHEYVDGPIFVPTPDNPHPLTGDSLPVVMGHEISGRVADLASDVTGVTVGDAVAIEPLITCGRCTACVDGHYNLCLNAGFHGYSGWGGGFADFVVVRAERVHRLGSVPTDIGALVEPLSGSYHAVRRSGAKPGDFVVVFGAGPMGLFITLILKALGVEDVVAVSRSTLRKVKAAEAGADPVLDPGEADVSAAVRTLTGGRGADVTFECTGQTPTLRTAIESTRSGGTLVNVAIWGKDAEINMIAPVMREINMIGTSAYCNDFAPVIQLLEDGKLDVSRFITRRVALENVVEEGIMQLLDNRDAIAKIIVHP